MPGMPRISGKAEKIAFKILGTPANLRKDKKYPMGEKTEKRLEFEETIRVR
jgi:hypothetical protein